MHTIKMSARLKAINDNLPQLKSSVEQLVTVISTECYTKGLIKTEDYQSLRNIQRSRREKTKALLDYVWGNIRDDDGKCEQFIQILEKHKYCQDLVSRIRGAQEDYENRSKVSQEKDSSRSMLLPTQYTSTQHLARPTQPSQCTESSTGTRNQTIGTSARIRPCSGVLGHYNTKMDVAQLQALINEAQEENEKSKAEKMKLQNKSDVMKKNRFDLEKKLQQKDRELDEVVVERDNLRDSTEMWISRLEKKHHADKKADKKIVDKRIAEDEEKIRELGKEKERLKADLKLCDERYQQMQEMVYQLNGVIMRYEPIIESRNSNLI